MLVIQEGDHRPLEVVGQRRRAFRQKPCGPPGHSLKCHSRLVDDRPKALLAAHVEDVPELRIHLITLAVRQSQPRREQRVGLALLHGGEVQIAEQPPRLEIASEQGIRHLPEEIPG